MEARFRDIIIEGDNLEVINAICSHEYGLTSAGVVVANIGKFCGFCNTLSFFLYKRGEQCNACVNRVLPGLSLIIERFVI